MFNEIRKNMAKDEKIAKWESQVRKGMLDFIILMCLAKQEFYGYELIKRIKDIAEINVSEGTIYPLLNRLKKEGLIASRWVEMESGIPRKYYQITTKGENILPGMKEAWKKFSLSIDQLMEEL
jgi:PadR family transcriptional regulator PadR